MRCRKSVLPFWRVGLLTDRGRSGDRPSTGFFAALRMTGIVGLLACCAEAAPPKSATVSFEREIKPLLQNYCYDCHGDGKHKAGLALDAYATAADVHADRPKWEAVLRNVSSHVMPPDDEPVVPRCEEK